VELSYLSAIGLAPNDEVIAIFCIAISLLALFGARNLRNEPYLLYLAASLGFFFISTAASVLKSLHPVTFELIEHIALLFSAVSIILAAHRYRKVEVEI